MYCTDVSAVTRQHHGVRPEDLHENHVVAYRRLFLGEILLKWCGSRSRDSEAYGQPILIPQPLHKMTINAEAGHGRYGLMAHG